MLKCFHQLTPSLSLHPQQTIKQLPISLSSLWPPCPSLSNKSNHLLLKALLPVITSNNSKTFRTFLWLSSNQRRLTLILTTLASTPISNKQSRSRSKSKQPHQQTYKNNVSSLMRELFLQGRSSLHQQQWPDSLKKKTKQLILQMLSLIQQQQELLVVVLMQQRVRVRSSWLRQTIKLRKKWKLKMQRYK